MRALLAIAVLAACGSGDSTSPAKAIESVGQASKTKRDALVATWKDAGLAPSPLAAATVPVGKDCQSGTVNDVDVVVCEYASADAAKRAESAGLAWVGATTGAAWTRDTLVIAAADRRKADPSGRTINRLMKPDAK